MIGESWAGPSASSAVLPPPVEKRGNDASDRADDTHLDGETNLAGNGNGEIMWDIMWSGWVKELPEPSLMHHM